MYVYTCIQAYTYVYVYTYVYTYIYNDVCVILCMGKFREEHT